MLAAAAANGKPVGTTNVPQPRFSEENTKTQQFASAEEHKIFLHAQWLVVFIVFLFQPSCFAYAGHQLAIVCVGLTWTLSGSWEWRHFKSLMQELGYLWCI